MMHARPFASTVTYALQPDGTSTTMENPIRLEPGGPARIAVALLSGPIARSVADNLTVLKQNLEHEPQLASRT